jgi:hypothetical protein
MPSSVKPRTLGPGTLVGLVLVAMQLCALAACGGGAQSPKAALHEYAQALREQQPERAYELMSSEFRAQHTLDEFRLMLKDNQEEAQQTADRLALDSSQVAISAEFEYGDAERMRLVKEDGAWHLATNPLDFYSQKTPREAVRSFVRAYHLKRWEVMLRFIPTTYRERMTVDMVKMQFEGPEKEKMADTMEVLRVNLGEVSADIPQGNQARLRYDTYEVELVREQGLWKIKSL